MITTERESGVPLVGFTAATGSGKTTLLAAVIPLLKRAGLRVGCIKHTHHHFDIDRPGKDSYVLRQAGAAQMLIGSAHRWALIVETGDEGEPPFGELLKCMQLDALDLILVEGFRLASIPKIEVHRQQLGEPLLCRQSDSIIALATDAGEVPGLALPILDLNAPERVARFILERFLPERGFDLDHAE